MTDHANPAADEVRGQYVDEDLDVLGPFPGAGLPAALAAVQIELPRIKKDQTAKVDTKQGPGYSYSYADLASVSAQVLPLLGKHGLSFTAFPTTTADGKFVLRYHLLHVSGERETGEYPLPTGGTAQALGSAITYARRYCLCAVTGVSPDDDDDAAAADGAKAAERAEAQAVVSKELSDARDAVRGAWAVQFGAFDGDAAGEMFRKWAKGGTLTNATAGQLRAFTGYLHALPAADAGSDPGEATLLPPAGEQQGQAPAEPKKMTKLQQGKIFASMADLGLTERQQQLRFLSDAVGRVLKSRSELTFDDAKVVIDILEEATHNVSGPAPSAQSAAGETRVPAGPDTTTSSGGA